MNSREQELMRQVATLQSQLAARDKVIGDAQRAEALARVAAQEQTKADEAAAVTAAAVAENNAEYERVRKAEWRNAILHRGMSQGLKPDEIFSLERLERESEIEMAMPQSWPVGKSAADFGVVWNAPGIAAPPPGDSGELGASGSAWAVAARDLLAGVK